jgi:hypothetical protein
MDSAKQQLADKLKSANNILVTVSRDPSVDQLAALLGLTLLINKTGKHSVAVFSGQVPSTIEFLEPEETIEKNTDSLRDFIIALDKNKADKLRYKVEDDVVRIFITPYKTSISQQDLEFSQGDFNVDVVVALGVKQQQDLDDAITAHGRILHDATLASINLGTDGGLGTINWHDQQASSLSELITELAPLIGEDLLDNQIATALLTGIVAETGRFSNDKTSSQNMSASSTLLAAGANQQLVASKLEEPAKPKTDAPHSDDTNQEDKPEATQSADGTLSIEHDSSEEPAQDNPSGDKPVEESNKPAEQSAELPAPAPPPEAVEPASSDEPVAGEHLSSGPQLVTEPPKLGGTLSANTQPEGLDPTTDPFSMPSSGDNKLLNHSAEPATSTPPSQPQSPQPRSFTPPPAAVVSPTPPPAPAPEPPQPPTGDQPQTLSEIEQSVHSSHLNNARDEVSHALSTGPDTSTPAPIAALNAQPLGDDLHPPVQPPLPTVSPDREPTLPLGATPAESADTNPQPAPSNDSLSPSPQVSDPTAPPPVPPPIPFQFNGSNGANPSPPPNQQNPPL